jgi:S1-C subfamily serine protease
MGKRGAGDEDEQGGWRAYTKLRRHDLDARRPLGSASRVPASFDTDVPGAILEWGVLQRSNDAKARTAWEAANLQRPNPGVWRAAALEMAHLMAILGPGRDPGDVRRKLDRAFLKLENELLVEPYRKDENLATPLREVTALGAELVAEGSHIEYLGEYLGGLPTVVRRWRPSVAMIYNPSGAGVGTGFLVAPSIVATAAHVVEDLPKLRVWFDGVGDVDHLSVQVPKMRRKGAGPDMDVALIRLGSVVGPTPVRLAVDYEVLDPVVALGYPLFPHAHEKAAPLLATSGEVSAVVNLRSEFEVVIVSCLVRGGHSGGPVLNRRGQAIGVVSGNLFHDAEERSGDLELGFPTVVPAQWLEDLLSDTI